MFEFWFWWLEDLMTPSWTLGSFDKHGLSQHSKIAKHNIDVKEI